MARLLYIKASPMGGLSHSTAVAEAFIDAYRRARPDCRPDTLDLFAESLPAFDLAAASAKYKLMHGGEPSAAERRVWAAVVGVIDRFKAAGLYVLAVPMWNFSIPYRLKHLVDLLVQPGLTFAVTETGRYKGLLTDKRAFIAYARGGSYPEGSEQAGLDFQRPYLEMVLRFVGLTEIASVVVEPTLAEGSEAAGRARAEAIEKARVLAGQYALAEGPAGPRP